MREQKIVHALVHGSKYNRRDIFCHRKVSARKSQRFSFKVVSLRFKSDASLARESLPIGILMSF